MVVSTITLLCMMSDYTISRNTGIKLNQPLSLLQQITSLPNPQQFFHFTVTWRQDSETLPNNWKNDATILNQE